MKTTIMIAGVCLLLLVVGASFSVQAKIYVWEDAEGRVHYASDPEEVPQGILDDEKQYRVIETTIVPSAGNAGTAPGSSAAPRAYGRDAASRAHSNRPGEIGGGGERVADAPDGISRSLEKHAGIPKKEQKPQQFRIQTDATEDPRPAAQNGRGPEDAPKKVGYLPPITRRSHKWTEAETLSVDL